MGVSEFKGAKPPLVIPTLNKSNEKLMLNGKASKDLYWMEGMPGLSGNYRKLYSSVEDMGIHREIDPARRMVLKLQEFTKGGFETFIYHQDLDEMRSGRERPEKKRGSVQDKINAGIELTEKEEQRDIKNKENSQKRAKSNCRKQIKEKGCDALLTLTKRERFGEEQDWATYNDWISYFAKFVRICRANGHDFGYVVVKEAHKKGNLHIHAAITITHSEVTELERLFTLYWREALPDRADGKTNGRADVSFREDMRPSERRSSLAKYVSKYITKSFGAVSFDRKRFHCSKGSPPAAKSILLLATNMVDALKEVAIILGLKPELFARYCFKVAPESAGSPWWGEYREGMLFDDPLFKEAFRA